MTNFRVKSPWKIARISTIATLSFIVCWGFAMVVAEIKPFWIDEWRVIYNLKYKDATMLWGPLDFLQQFPRVYLEIVKVFTSIFDYSYFALRLPSFIVGTAMIALCYRLMVKIFRRESFNRFLFVMMLVSASTFTDYYVEIKQYTMDLLLALVAIWQFIELLKLTNGQPKISGRYMWLCASFLVVPFFSYTYPIAIAPVFIIQFVQGVILLRDKRVTTGKTRILLQQWFPLFLCAASIVVFYMTDVKQLMADKGMHQYWGHLMMNKGFSWSSFFYECYNMFAEIGAGAVYWYLFGVLGVVSFLYGVFVCVANIKRKQQSASDLILLYSALLVLIAILLFSTGKFPLGEPRLNAFMIPVIAVLLIRLLDGLSEHRRWNIVSKTVSVVLLAGVTGNVYTTFYASLTGPEYTRKMEIYRSTEKALLMAQSKKLPTMITPEVAWPYDKTRNYPFNNTVPGDWVLKTFPAYHVANNMPVYAITNMASLREEMKRLPANITSVLAGDGRSFSIIIR